jgi:pilus assembly protein CpaE
MSSAKEIVLLSKDQGLYENIVPIFSGSDMGFQVSLVRDLVSLTNRLESRIVAFVLIDFDGDASSLMGDIESMTSRFVHTRFITLTNNLSNELVIKSMQSGIRHVQVKQFMNTELLDVLVRLMPDVNTTESRPGKCITVLSAGGGSGVTTLVVNLAYELQANSPKPVLLVDMDYSYGSVASYLELNARYGIADVLSHPGNVDGNLIDTTSVQCTDSLRALISPASIDFHNSKELDISQLSQVLAACKQGNAFTVIDAPRISMQAAAALGESSDATLVVFQPTVKDIRVAKSMISSLSNNGIPADRIKPILNRYRKRRETVTFEEAQEAIGDFPITRLSNDYAAAVKGINFGKPLSISSPRSTLRKEVSQLAKELTDQDGTVEKKINSWLPAEV